MTDVTQIPTMGIGQDQQSIKNALARQTASATGTDSVADQKDMFLKLLVAQLKNQDPSSPMDQKDMMAQMAQFSQVEQSQNMVKAVQTLTSNSAVANSIGLIGHDVGYSVTDAGTQETTIKTGKVTSITNNNGEVSLWLNDGASIDPAAVVKVS
jgi:flagellar basal-body rod modification protein FlgD